MKLNIKTGKLSSQMKEHNVGRVHFKHSIEGRDMDVYFATDVGADMLVFVDPRNKLPFFYLKSEKKNELYTIPFKDFDKMAQHFTSGAKEMGLISSSLLIFEGSFVEVITRNIERWVSKFNIPDYTHTELVDYTVFPRIFFEKKDRKPFLVRVRTASPKPTNYEKNCLAFGKKVADFLLESQKITIWSDNPAKENCCLLEHYLLNEDWYGRFTYSDEIRLIKYK